MSEIKVGKITPDNIISFIEKEFDANNKEGVIKLVNILNDKCKALNTECKLLKNLIKDQDKLSFCIEKLNEVKEYADEHWWVDGVSECIVNFIDNKIAELKEQTINE